MYNFSIMQIASELLTELPLQMSAPGSPGRSRPSSRPASRPQSPTRGSRPSPLQPIGLRATSKDPLKAFPTDVSQQIFSLLSIKDLARCSRVSKKWNKSQTLNYGASPSDRHRSAGSLTTHDVQFGSSSTGKRISMMKAFHQGSGPSASPSRIGYVFCIQAKMPPEPYKFRYQRTTYLHTIPNRSPPQSPRSGYITPRSGTQTPREIREDKWRQEAEPTSRPSKVEMREMYKELGGRKARGKGKLGGTAGMRDRGGWGDLAVEE